MKAALLSAAAALMFLAACGSSNPECQAACTAYNACTVAQRPVNYDCPEYCNDFARAEAAGGFTCNEQFDTYVTCLNQNVAQICNAEDTSCATAATGLDDCLTTFCASTAGEKSELCTDGEPAIFTL